MKIISIKSILPVGLVFSTLLVTGSTLWANTLETTYWENSILSKKLQSTILNVLKERCPNGIADFGLKEDGSIIRLYSEDEDGKTFVYTSTFTSHYQRGRQSNYSQSIDVESFERFDKNGQSVEAKVKSFRAECPQG